MNPRILAVCASFLIVPLRAGAEEIGFELYSWKAGSAWNYAIFEGAAPARALDALKTSENKLKDISFLKGRIASLPSGEKLHWREDKRRGLRLPPHEIIKDVARFAAGAQIVLLLPGQGSDAKALEQLQSDVHDFVAP